MSLRIEGLVSGYREEEVLHGLTLQVNEKESVAVLGPNGAGKTTLLKTIIGIIRPKSGRVVFEDKEISCLSPPEILKLGICYVPQGGNVLSSLTVRENLLMGGYIIKDRGKVNQQMRKVFEHYPILCEKKDVKAGTLSGGQRQMLAIGRAEMLEPKILMLDEPSLGLAPKIVTLVFKQIESFHASGRTILLVEQNVKKALQVTTRAYLIESGTIRRESQSQELYQSVHAQELYLGKATI